MTNISNISINKKKLDEYLSDFHPSRVDELKSLFTEDDFSRGPSSFLQIMKSKISMPKLGKTSLRYWTSRGWDEYESEEKRVKLTVGKKSPMCLEFWMEKGLSEEEAEYKIKTQRKTNKEYWTSRGYSDVDAEIKIIEFQMSSSRKLAMKFKNDDKFREIMKSKQSVNIEYWLNLGYSEEDAKQKLSERQSTFSLEKCISKYGEIEGSKIWKDRQVKWQNSLSKSNYNGSDGKDSSSIAFVKNKFGEDWVDGYLQSNSMKDREFLKFLLTFDSYENMIDYLIGENIPYYHIFLKINNLIIPEYFKTSYSKIHEYLISKYPFMENKGTPEYFKFKYGDDWANQFIEKKTFKDKLEVMEMLNFENYKDLVDYLVGKNLSVTEINLKVSNKLITAYYNCTTEDILKYLMSLNVHIQGKYGRMRHFNNHLCRSDAEFIIAKFLVDNNIDYIYEKKYPNSNYKCDFYITKIDCYVEFTGMGKEKYKSKENFCIENGLKHIYSSSIKQITNYLKYELSIIAPSIEPPTN